MDPVKSISDQLSTVSLSDADKEEYSIDAIVKLILEISVRVKCSVLTRTRALVIYHEFKKGVGHYVYDRYDDYLVAGACLDISIKINEEPVEQDVLIFTIFCISKKNIDSVLSGPSASENAFEQLKHSFPLMKSIILRMTEFSVYSKVAHEYLLFFMNDLREQFVDMGIWDVLLEHSFKLASDFYLTNKYAIYTAEDIAVTIIEYSMRLFHVEIPSTKTWLQSLSYVTNKNKKEIWEHLFKIGIVSPVLETKG